jgi:hypothetical protein
VKILFVPEKLSRSLSKEEWKKCDRWRRVTQKVLAQYDKEMLELATEMTTNAVLYGSSDSEHVRKMQQDLYDKIINPPLLLGPHMDEVKW